MLAPWKESWDKPRQCIKKQRHHFANKGLYSQSYGFSSSYLWVLELEDKEGWTLKNWYFWIVVLEKTLESNLDSREIKPINSRKEINPEYSLEGFAEAEVPILWPPDAKKRLGKTLMLGKIESKRRSGQQRMRRLDSIMESMDRIRGNSRK